MNLRGLLAACAIGTVSVACPVALGQSAGGTGGSGGAAPYPIFWINHGPAASGVNFAGVPIQTDKVHMFYEHTIGKYPRIYVHPQTGAVWPAENGGIPQRANMTAHLDEVRRDIAAVFPDPNWDGVVMLDFESWQPVWDQLTNQPMRQLSREHVRQRFPSASAAQVDFIAGREFEYYGVDFLKRTIQTCKAERPRATWGFTGYPLGFTQAQHDIMRPIYNEMDTWFISNYVFLYGIPEGQTPANPWQRSITNYVNSMSAHIGYARAQDPDKPVRAVVAIRYQATNPQYVGQGVNDLDLMAALRVPWQQGTLGTVFWDYAQSQSDVQALNTFFAGRGGEGIRTFLDEVSPPPPPPPAPPTTGGNNPPPNNPPAPHQFIRANDGNQSQQPAKTGAARSSGVQTTSKRSNNTNSSSSSTSPR